MVRVSSQAAERGRNRSRSRAIAEQVEPSSVTSRPGSPTRKGTSNSALSVAGPLGPVVHEAPRRTPTRSRSRATRQAHFSNPTGLAPPAHHERAQRERREHRQPDLAVGDVDQVRVGPVQQRLERRRAGSDQAAGERQCRSPGRPPCCAAPARAAGPRPGPPRPSPTRSDRSCVVPQPTRTSCLPRSADVGAPDARSADAAPVVHRAAGPVINPRFDGHPRPCGPNLGG